MITPTPFLPLDGYIPRWPVPPGLLNTRDKMFDLAPTHCRVVVEIGSERGWWAARAAVQLPESTIWCIDPWPDPPPKRSTRGDDLFREWIINTSPWRDRILPVRMKSKDAVSFFTEPIDFLFIDGDHSYEGVRSDLTLWAPKVRPGGLVVGDDLGGPRRDELRQALEDVWSGKYRSGQLYAKDEVRTQLCFYRKM